VIPNHTKKITAPQRRALTLISKIIQNMANGTVFGSKEGFMTQANPTIEAGTPIVTAFLQVISTEEVKKQNVMWEREDKVIYIERERGRERDVNKQCITER
tara:strand:+ start:110 stop:412 length:303 start_codon:yes stop_codon:yes gene_type:complete